MTAEMFARSTGIELTRIPYKGNGQAVGDLIGGQSRCGAVALDDPRQRQDRRPRPIIST